MSLPIRTTPEADAHIRDIDAWWRSNRPARRNVFLNEPSKAFEIVGHAPQIGRLYRHSPIPGVRRVLLSQTRYHVYYESPSNGRTRACDMARPARCGSAVAHAVTEVGVTCVLNNLYPCSQDEPEGGWRPHRESTNVGNGGPRRSSWAWPHDFFVREMWRHVSSAVEVSIP